MSEKRHCRSCKAPIVWATFARGGKRAPFDAKPTSVGRWIIADGIATEVIAPGLDADLFVPHFATCPDAAKWRGGKQN